MSNISPWFTLHRILALINLFILLVLSSDAFLLPATRVREVYDHRSSYGTHTTYRSSRVSTDYINTVSGEEFLIPDNWQRTNIGLNGGDTFYVDRSFLFRQPTALYFHWRGKFERMDMGFFNHGFWIPVMIIYIVLVSILHLLPWLLIRNKERQERLIFYGTALLLVVVFLYFYH